jgi:hypothetical protein
LEVNCKSSSQQLAAVLVPGVKVNAVKLPAALVVIDQFEYPELYGSNDPIAVDASPNVTPCKLQERGAADVTWLNATRTTALSNPLPTNRKIPTGSLQIVSSLILLREQPPYSIRRLGV